MALVHIVQHGDKLSSPGDPGLSDAGRLQAAMTARWLSGAGLCAVYSSPLRRALETADVVAAVTDLAVQRDIRLRERMSWDGSCTYQDFLAEWFRTVHDRDFVPRGGESSRQAGDRLQGFLSALPSSPGPVAVVTHGGVTVDLLRNLLPDHALPAGLLEHGIPPCAVTTVDGIDVLAIAVTGHLT